MAGGFCLGATVVHRGRWSTVLRLRQAPPFGWGEADHKRDFIQQHAVAQPLQRAGPPSSSVASASTFRYARNRPALSQCTPDAFPSVATPSDAPDEAIPRGGFSGSREGGVTPRAIAATLRDRGTHLKPYRCAHECAQCSG